MILNISGRTDIVAFYTPWLIKRLQAGFVDVRNPIYPQNVSRIYFQDVDMYVFCTKDPLPIIPYLNEFKKPILFHVTLTPYKKDIEPNVIDKKEIIKGIKKISNIIGKEKVYVRYDPILLNEKYPIDYHIKAFTKVCELLQTDVDKTIISFIDLYKNVQNNAKSLKLEEMTEDKIKLLAQNLGKIAQKYGMKVQMCYEKYDLEEYGITNEPCVSKELAFKLTNKKHPKWQARNCGCVSMVDIGAYNSCHHLCKYCYANYDEKKVQTNILKHDVNSTMLLGKLEKDDIVKRRTK